MNQEKKLMRVHRRTERERKSSVSVKSKQKVLQVLGLS